MWHKLNIAREETGIASFTSTSKLTVIIHTCAAVFLPEGIDVFTRLSNYSHVSLNWFAILASPFLADVV